MVKTMIRYLTPSWLEKVFFRLWSTWDERDENPQVFASRFSRELSHSLSLSLSLTHKLTHSLSLTHTPPFPPLLSLCLFEGHCVGGHNKEAITLKDSKRLRTIYHAQGLAIFAPNSCGRRHFSSSVEVFLRTKLSRVQNPYNQNLSCNT